MARGEAQRAISTCGSPTGVDAHVRRARRDDLDGLLGLLSQLQGQPIRRTEALARTYAQMLAQPGRAILLAERAGRPAGTLGLLIVPSLTHGARPWATIENVIVDEAHRRHGVGRALIEAALGLAREADCCKAQLVSHVRRTEAHALYEGTGFEVPVRGFRRQL